MATLPTIGPTLFLRFEADSITAAVGAAVDSWPESSGQGHPAAAQTNSAKRPTVAAGPNGHKAVDFDGTDDGLTLSGSALGLRNSTDAVTLFMLFMPQATSTASPHVINLSNNGSSSTTFFQYRLTGTSRQHSLLSKRLDADTIASAFGPSSGTPQDDVLYLATAVYDYANSDALAYGNGTSQLNDTTFGTAGTTQALNSAAGTIGMSLSGTASFWVGHLVALFAYRGKPTDAERAAVHSYFQDQYGITVSDYTGPSFDAAAFDAAAFSTGETPIPESTASLSLALGLTATSEEVGVSTGTLGLGLAVTATSAEVEVATASLGLGLGLAATAAQVVTSTGTLGLSFTPSAAALEVGVSTGTVGVGLGLTAAAVEVGVSTATLGLGVGLSGTATDQPAVSTASLGVGYSLAATSAEVGVSLATLGVGYSLTTTSTEVGVSTAKLQLGLGLAAAAVEVGISTAAVGLGLGLVGAAGAATASTATLGVRYGLTATSELVQVAVATAQLTLDLALTADAAVVVASTGALELSWALSADSVNLDAYRDITVVFTGPHARPSAVAGPRARLTATAGPAARTAALTGPRT